MGDIGRIYIDTNIFIAAFEKREALGEALTRAFSKGAMTGQPRFATSELTLAELLVHPVRNADERLVDFYRQLLSSTNWLSVSPVSRAVLEKAAAFRAKNPTCKLPDAIHIATAIELGCSHIISDDTGIWSVLSGEPSLSILSADEATIASLTESLSE